MQRFLQVIHRHQMSMVMMMTMTMTVMVMVVDDTVVAGEVASVSASLLLRVTHHQILVRQLGFSCGCALFRLAWILDVPLHFGLFALHVTVLSDAAQIPFVQPVVQPLHLRLSAWHVTVLSDAAQVPFVKPVVHCLLLHFLLDTEVVAVLVTLVVVCVADHHEQPLVGPLRLVLDDVARSLAVPPQPAVRLLLLALVPVVVEYIHKSEDVKTNQ